MFDFLFRVRFLLQRGDVALEVLGHELMWGGNTIRGWVESQTTPLGYQFPAGLKACKRRCKYRDYIICIKVK